MKLKTRNALFLSAASELKKLSYAVGAVLAANHIFGWIPAGKSSIVLAGVWFLLLQVAAHFLVYKAGEEGNDSDAGEEYTDNSG